MKALILGSSGMLGTDVVGALIERGHTCVSAPKTACDITDIRQVRRAIAHSTADLVINCAAYTKVDQAETDVDTAFAVNAAGAANVARATAEASLPVIHISTDYVFDGTATTAYLECTPINPKSVYGQSKALGDYQVQRLNPQHLVVRTQWLYGNHGPNFVSTMLRLATSRDTLTVVDDQWGSPTYTYDLARALVQLAEDRSYGTYHLTNSDYCTWKEFAEAIMAAAKFDVTITGISTELYGSPAPRPRFGVLDNRQWRSEGRSPLRGFNDALAHFLAHTPNKVSA